MVYIESKRVVPMQAESTSEGRGITEVVGILRPRILAIMSRYQVPAADGEDLIQEAVLAALERGQEIGNMEGWLLTVIRNRCSVYQRRRICWKRLLEFVDPLELQTLATPLDPPQEYQDVCRDVRLLSRQLSDEEKALLRMCFGELLGRKEIAARMHCHPANIVKLLRRVLARLRIAAGLRTACR